MNNIIKISDKKLFYAVVSLDKTKLYIISIFNYDQEKLIKRIYEVPGLLYNNFNFFDTIRINIYNKFLAFCSNGIYMNESFSALIVFSYPNSTETNIELTDFLQNNEIKINNITIEVKDMCKIENNIFGYISTGIKIISINKSSNEYLSFNNGIEISENQILANEDILKLEIEKTDDIYEQFNYSLQYVCIAKDPEYSDYLNYPIKIEDTGTTNKEDNFYESNRV